MDWNVLLFLLFIISPNSNNLRTKFSCKNDQTPKYKKKKRNNGLHLIFHKITIRTWKASDLREKSLVGLNIM